MILATLAVINNRHVSWKYVFATYTEATVEAYVFIQVVLWLAGLK